MALQETAQKAYTRYGGDAEKTYKARRFSIRQQLPHMTASQLQKHLRDLDEEIADLKNEIAQFEGWVRQIKREGSACWNCGWTRTKQRLSGCGGNAESTLGSLGFARQRAS